MGLKNSNSTVNDLKATFFDVFCDHTEELAALIEVLANDPTADAMQIESIIFQRIIMLSRTVGNIRGLMSNVDDLNSVKGVGLKNNKVSVDSVSKPGPVSTNNNVSVPTTVPQQIVGTSVVPTTVPQQSVATSVAPTTVPQQIQPTSVVPTTAPQQNDALSVVPTTAPLQSDVSLVVPTTVPLQNDVAVPTTVPQQVISTVPVTKPSVTSTTGPQKSMTQILTQNSHVKAPVQNTRLSFVKSSDDKVKAILVNDSQFNKLRASRVVQTKVLGFGIGESPSKAKIEDLMKKASALYKEGKISEAQALYAEISSLNKQLKRNDTKVLTKVA